jgi:hypothetical protein
VRANQRHNGLHNGNKEGEDEGEMSELCNHVKDYSAQDAARQWKSWPFSVHIVAGSTL